MRLTRLRNDGQYLRNNKNIDECINKLGQLEDIEEELGIDLITLFKAKFNKCYVKPKPISAIFEGHICDFTKDYFVSTNGMYLFKDYRKMKVFYNLMISLALLISGYGLEILFHLHISMIVLMIFGITWLTTTMIITLKESR